MLRYVPAKWQMLLRKELLIDFVDCWLHLGIAQASLALLSVCAAILHSSFFILHFLKIFQQLFSCECIVLPSLV